MRILYIVATPIGNLQDITFRAISTLKEVEYIACEDTRKTSKLLRHYEIEGKRLLACHAHNERSSAQGIIKLLKDNKKIAYCSDAGTPSLSDPGARLVQSVLAEGIKVVPIPGPSALATLYSVSGLINEPVLFAGFLPQRGEKRSKALKDLLALPCTILLYESPYRVENLIRELATLDMHRQVVVGREMTKMYEEFWRGSALELAQEITNFQLVGEFALIISRSDKC